MYPTQKTKIQHKKTNQNHKQMIYDRVPGEHCQKIDHEATTNQQHEYHQTHCANNQQQTIEITTKLQPKHESKTNNNLQINLKLITTNKQTNARRRFLCSATRTLSNGNISTKQRIERTVKSKQTSSMQDDCLLATLHKTN